MHVGSGDDGSGKNKLKLWNLNKNLKLQSTYSSTSQPFCLLCFTFAVVLGFSLPQKKVSNFPISYYD